MAAYLSVFAHSYCVLTNQTGTFRLTGILLGKHPIRVWHETLGILEKMVNIAKKGVARVSLAYP